MADKAGLQTFNADGTTGYDGFSSMLRCSFSEVIPYNGSVHTYKRQIPGVYDNYNAGLARVFVCDNSQLYDTVIRSIAADDTVTVDIMGYWTMLVVMEWGKDAQI